MLVAPPANPVPNSLLFKWNARRHYACPSTHNSFGGYNVRHLILDTGCTTVLLPIPTNDHLQQLLALFNNDQHTWKVAASRNAGPVSSCTLVITRVDNTWFTATMCQTTTPYTVQLPNLRFSVSYDDAMALRTASNTGILPLVGIPTLQEYIATLDGIRAALPALQVGTRRDYALIGQDMLQGRYMFQSGDLAMICTSQATAPPQTQRTALLNICIDWIGTEFAAQEFDFIDDDDHGDVPELDAYLTATDE